MPSAACAVIVNDALFLKSASVEWTAFPSISSGDSAVAAPSVTAFSSAAQRWRLCSACKPHEPHFRRWPIEFEPQLDRRAFQNSQFEAFNGFLRFFSGVGRWHDMGLGLCQCEGLQDLDRAGWQSARPGDDFEFGVVLQVGPASRPVRRAARVASSPDLPGPHLPLRQAVDRPSSTRHASRPGDIAARPRRSGGRRPRP